MLTGRFLEKYDRAVGSKHRRRLNESVQSLNVDDMSFEEQLEFLWFIGGMDMLKEWDKKWDGEPVDVNSYYKEHPDELRYEVECDVEAIEDGLFGDDFLSEWEQYKANGYHY